MNYQEFVSEVKKKVERILGGSLRIEVMTTLKNNDQERVGLTIMNHRVNISPTIYLEEYYEQFQNDFTLEEIAESIVELYQDIKFEYNWQTDMIQDFDAIKPLIAYKLINRSRNEAFLSAFPHKPYQDLAIVFYVLFDVDDSGTATIPINYDLMRMWNTSLEEIYDIACQNMPDLLPAHFKPMHVAITELLKDTPYKYAGEHSPLYVLTNSLGCFGASCILYDGILKEIGNELGENYYILPSSIHEMIILPESVSPLRADLNDMMREINETQTSPEEILSDNTYFYDRTLEYMY